MRSRRHLAMSRSAHTSAFVALCALALAVPAGAASAAPDDPDGEAAVTQQLQEVQSLPSQWWWDESGPDTRRARALLRQMTLDEKVDMLHGELNNFYGFYNGPIERLGIPALTMADGPAGVRIANPAVNDQEATQLPSPIALAATWDTALAEQYGQVAGDEAFRTGHNVLLSPAVDIARVAQAGRAFEALGEDPLLSGTMGAAEIRGIQSHPVVADIKHYNVYTQETNRLSGGNAVVDERALQEIYTRPFAIGVEQGRPGSAMCAFNKVNGVYACESDELLNRILKAQLDFEGWVMSDYGATHSTTQAILGGLDQEMPGNTTPQTGPGACFFCGPLLDAVRAGQVPVSRIDDAVLRILRPMFALGLFDNPPVVSALPEAEHGAFARQVAERSAVLLKNDSAALPLQANVGSIAVIGADADSVVAGGGSSLVKPTYTVSPLEGIQARAGAGVLVRHVAGADPVTSASLIPGPDPIPSDFLSTGAENGLRAEYFTEPDFTGPIADRTDPYAAINAGFFLFQGFNAQSPHFPLQTRDMAGSIRWTGTLTAPVDGTYGIAVTTTGSATVTLDGAAVLIAEPTGEVSTTSVDVDLVAGVEHELLVEYVNDGPGGTDAGAVFQLGWTTPDGVVAPQALAAADLARSSQAAVVLVRDYSSEGGDKPDLDLPNGQAELIRQVAAANPRTVVVLVAGGAVQTSDWESGVPAIIHSWFGGQEQGNALAGILFGDVNPSGRLPISLPVDEDSTPVSTPEQYPGVGLDQLFTEGIYVGYRGYEEFDITPQYSFGHGLSYTTYDYRNLRTAPSAQGLQVKVAVRNTGAVTGTETVQVYVGNLPTRQVQSAPKVLAGWATVTLQPGERQQVTVALSPESVSYWDVDRDRWRTPRGDIPVYVGSSSTDIRLTGTLRTTGRPAR
ncbi:glycoside hydrolase family 3 C-terminal domain-containing protein [Cellulomonas humilata]|uniref:Beta-glucosidase n=1 Tax=Cellulomonas humilata TaxID=144055 RepID=A0ABU0EIV2_9CELL|nr:glycoside hydrolase family 3 C-terminal domain-containing protein [Cellulomonas humilata]MDQ0374767.1 beta-glucosidase [Cellulomonas humilata]